MPDKTRRLLHAVSTLGLVACALMYVPNAHACNSDGSVGLVWPKHDGLDAPRLAPTDTQIWLGVPVPWRMPADVLLSDADEGIVETTLEVLTSPTDLGVDQTFLVLTPKVELAPSSTYTVTSVSEDDEREEDVRDSWSFKTGASSHAGTFPVDLDREYYVFERDERFLNHCEERVYDTAHILRLSSFSSDVPFLHTFEVAYPDGSKNVTHRVWSGAIPHRDDLRFVLGESLDQTGYPCVSHTMTDVSGTSRRDDLGCAPSFCVDPPPVGNEGDRATRDGYASFFNQDFDALRRTATTCSHGVGGCSTTPASPIPHAPLALGGLALLCLLTTRRTRPERGEL